MSDTMKHYADFKLVFEAMPGRSTLLAADYPHFTIIATTDDYLSQTLKIREDVYGKGFFEVFEEHDSGIVRSLSNLRKSFNKVIETGESDILPEERYDLLDESENFAEFYWRAVSRPVKDDSGMVRYIIHTGEDITAQVQAKNRTKQLEGYAPAYNLFHQAPVAIAIIRGSRLVIELANASMLHLWGKGEDVIGLELENVLPELRHQGLIDVIDDVRLTGNPYYGFEQYVMLVKNGVRSDNYYTFFYQPYYEEGNPEPEGIMIFATDVTDKVIATKTINDKEEVYKQALLYRKALLEAHNAASLDGILLVGPDGRILSWNQRFIDIWEIPVEILAGGDDSAALKEAAKRVRDPEGFRSKVNELYMEKVRSSIDVLEFVNGKIIERQGYPVIGENGDYFAWSWTFRDVTESKTVENNLRESEARYKELSESLEQIVRERTFKMSQLNETYKYAENIGKFGSYRYHFGTRVITYSDNFYRLLGCEPQEFPASGEAFAKFIHPEDREHVTKSMAEALGKPTFSKWEYRLIRKNGEKIYVRGTGSTITGEDGQQYLIGTLQDISDEKEHERQLQEKNAALQAVNKELESFAYISSHDLQEPLRKIQTFASRLIDGELDKLSESGRGYFEKIQNAALRMQTLIDDLLAYSRSNSEEKNFEVINLRNIMDEIIDELQEEISVYHAEMILGNMEDVKVIPFQFKQIMHNLIGNALKFSRREELPRIVIDSRNAPGSEFPEVSLPAKVMYCHISVSDNGIGFIEQYSEKIFEVFQRLHGKDKYSGTGIGLAIVKKIVENHDGIITAKGTPGVGATFNIYIPSA